MPVTIVFITSLAFVSIFAPHVATLVTAPTMLFQILAGVSFTIVTMFVSIVFITSLALVCIFAPHVATLVTALTILFQIFCGSSLTISITFVTKSVITVSPFSCIFAPHSAIFSTPATIACGIRVGSSFILFMIVVTSLPAAVKILGSPVISPVTMAAIICGMAAIKSGIASMMPSISATIISPALSIISGMPSISAFMIAVMISGSASISTGNAATSPCASPVISCKAAVISSGIFSISMVTIFVTTVTIVGSNVGSACAIPCARLMSICIPASKICGSNCISIVAMLVTTFVMVGNNVGSAVIMPCASACIIEGALSSTAPAIFVITSNICGIICEILLIIPVTPCFIFSPASSCPAIRSLSPSIIIVIDGSISPVILFFTPLNVHCKRLKLSSNAALAATASSDIIMPYSSVSSISCLIPSAPELSNGKSSAALFPKISCAAAFRCVSSSMPASASMLSKSTCSVLFILPSVFFSDTPIASKLAPAPFAPSAVFPSSVVIFLTPLVKSLTLLPLLSQA